jgi:hypothetical protein
MEHLASTRETRQWLNASSSPPPPPLALSAICVVAVDDVLRSCQPFFALTTLRLPSKLFGVSSCVRAEAGDDVFFVGGSCHTRDHEEKTRMTFLRCFKMISVHLA